MTDGVKRYWVDDLNLNHWPRIGADGLPRITQNKYVLASDHDALVQGLQGEHSTLSCKLEDMTKRCLAAEKHCNEMNERVEALEREQGKLQGVNILIEDKGKLQNEVRKLTAQLAAAVIERDKLRTLVEQATAMLPEPLRGPFVEVTTILAARQEMK